MEDFEKSHVFNTEVEYWVLHNKMTNDVYIRTMHDLIYAFGEYQITQMMNGHHDYWDVYKHYQN